MEIEVKKKLDSTDNNEEKRKREKIISLSEREKKMMEVIDKLRIARSEDLAWLCGYSDFSYCRKCLRKLEVNGFVNIASDRKGKKCYYLSGKGLNEIGKMNSHVYEISYNTNHELLVGRVCSYLKIVEGKNIDDMITDLMMKNMFKRKEHRPDLIIDNVCYEVELNHKKIEKWEKNILSNERFDRQVWIVPDDKRNIAKNLVAIAKRVAVDIEILYLSVIKRIVSDANIHNNVKDEKIEMKFQADVMLKEKKESGIDSGESIVDRFLSYVEGS